MLPIFLSLVSLFIVVLTIYQKPHESALAIGLVIVGAIVYVVGYKWKNKPKAIQGKIGEFWFQSDIQDQLFRKGLNVDTIYMLWQNSLDSL